MPEGLGPPTNGANTRTVCMITDVAIVGDYYEISMQQTSGGNLTCSLDEFTAIFITR